MNIKMKDCEFVKKYKYFLNLESFTRREIKKAKRTVMVVLNNKDSYYPEELKKTIKSIFIK